MAFTFQVANPEHREKKGKLDLSYWVYNIRANTTLEQYANKQLLAVRRYSDFEFLRNQLCDEYPWTIVPPIPNKAIAGTLDKFVGSQSKVDPLLQYRQRALYKFLVRIGAHPQLAASRSLQDFLELDEEEWTRYMKAPRNKSITASMVSAVTGNATINPDTVNTQALASVIAGLAKTVAAESGVMPAASTAAMWEDVKGYIVQLEFSLNLLHDRLLMLVKRRRDTSRSLREFGRAFSAIGEVERSFEPTPLSNVLTSIGQHSETLSNSYVEHAESETQQVIETLMYYVGLCAAVKEVIKKQCGLISDRDSTANHLTECKAKLSREVARGGAPEKVRKLETDVETLTSKSQNTATLVQHMDAAFKEELRRFHREKQYDMKAMMKAFVDLQLHYAGTVKQSWDELLPQVNEAKP